MKNTTEMKKRVIMGVLSGLLVFTLIGCGSSETGATENESGEIEVVEDADTGAESTGETETEAAVAETEAVGTLPDLSIQFGEGGVEYTMALIDNDTAATIAQYVGEQSWNLPIYDFDNFENWEVMQYYDIASRYEIPDGEPETYTSEKAGEVYYSAPNRVILFYQDAEVTGDFVKIGDLTSTDGLYDAVNDNPVLEGWGNKLVTIAPAD